MNKSREECAEELQTGPFSGWVLTPKQQAFLELCWSDAVQDDSEELLPASLSSS